MIDYDNTFEQLEITCDSCGDNETFEGDFYECIDEAKSNGWRIIKSGNSYDHFCQSCSEESNDFGGYD